MQHGREHHRLHARPDTVEFRAQRVDRFLRTPELDQGGAVQRERLDALRAVESVDRGVRETCHHPHVLADRRRARRVEQHRRLDGRSDLHTERRDTQRVRIGAPPLPLEVLAKHGAPPQIVRALPHSFGQHRVAEGDVRAIGAHDAGTDERAHRLGVLTALDVAEADPRHGSQPFGGAQSGFGEIVETVPQQVTQRHGCGQLPHPDPPARSPRDRSAGASSFEHLADEHGVPGGALPQLVDQGCLRGAAEDPLRHLRGLIPRERRHLDDPSGHISHQGLDGQGKRPIRRAHGRDHPTIRLAQESGDERLGQRIAPVDVVDGQVRADVREQIDDHVGMRDGGTHQVREAAPRDIGERGDTP